MKILLFLFSFVLITPVFSVERLTCQQHFQKMYTASTTKLALERNESLCHESFKDYLKDNNVSVCKDTVDLFCKTLTKSKVRVENYSYNPIKTAAMLQGGYALGMAGATAIMNLFSPPLDVPKPTTKKRKEKAQRQMTESECLYQTKAEGVVGYRYQKSNKRCYVTGCEKGYVKSNDHSICVFKAEEECLAKNGPSYAKANATEHIVRWGYGRGLDESADCYIAQCSAGWSPDTYGAECEPDMDPEIIVKKKAKKKVVKSKYGVGGGSKNDAFYKSANAMSDNFNLASAYSFRGHSSKIYFTGDFPAPPGKPDGSPLRSSRIGGMYGMRKLSWEKNWRPHKGIDLSCSTGIPIHATGDGKVISAGYAGGCGLAIEIEHDDGVHKTRYCHLSQIKVYSGSVSRGTIIGLCGSTGNSSGPHLHYEVKQNWFLKNPIYYLTGGRKP